MPGVQTAGFLPLNRTGSAANKHPLAITQHELWHTRHRGTTWDNGMHKCSLVFGHDLARQHVLVIGIFSLFAGGAQPETSTNLGNKNIEFRASAATHTYLDIVLSDKPSNHSGAFDKLKVWKECKVLSSGCPWQ